MIFPGKIVITNVDRVTTSGFKRFPFTSNSGIRLISQQGNSVHINENDVALVVAKRDTYYLCLWTKAGLLWTHRTDVKHPDEKGYQFK